MCDIRNIDLTQQCKYTKQAQNIGQARLISCEFDKHGLQCQHGDCTCKCHFKETPDRNHKNYT